MKFTTFVWELHHDSRRALGGAAGTRQDLWSINTEPPPATKKKREVTLGVEEMTKKPQKTSQKQLLQDIQRNPPAAPKLGMGSGGVKPHQER